MAVLIRVCLTQTQERIKQVKLSCWNREAGIQRYRIKMDIFQVTVNHSKMNDWLTHLNSPFPAI